MAVNIIAQTSALPKKLYSGQLSATANTTVATVASATTWSIMSAVVCNTTGSAATLTLDLVESGGTSAANRRILSAFPVGAGETMPLNDVLAGVQMTAGDFIAAWAGTASALTLTITGVEGT